MVIVIGVFDYLNGYLNEIIDFDFSVNILNYTEMLFR